jgi:hypothetical protein
MLRRRFAPSIWEWDYSKEPLLSTYKRRPHPPHFNYTLRAKS